MSRLLFFALIGLLVVPSVVAPGGRGACRFRGRVAAVGDERGPAGAGRAVRARARRAAAGEPRRAVQRRAAARVRHRSVRRRGVHLPGLPVRRLRQRHGRRRERGHSRRGRGTSTIRRTSRGTRGTRRTSSSSGSTLAADSVAYRITLNSLVAADSTIVVIAFDTDRDATTGVSVLPRDPGAPFPGTDEAITTWGTGAMHNSFSSSTTATTVPVTTDLEANQITVTVPRSVSDPRGHVAGDSGGGGARHADRRLDAPGTHGHGDGAREARARSTSRLREYSTSRSGSMSR